MKFTEAQIAKMASPISETEEEKCKRAIHMVRDALKELNYTDDGQEIASTIDETYSFALAMRKQFSDVRIKLLVQGSYANKTNIRSESDVDVAVILESTFQSEYRAGITGASYGFSRGTFSVSELKNDVEQALNRHFGYEGVERHDKSIKVIGNTYRVDADVVPSYRYRDYTDDYRFDTNNYVGGIMILPDSGGRIINYPEQHIKNGIEKNKRTSYRFKKFVRVIKSMREELKLAGHFVPSEISSFGLESLLWNVSDSVFHKYSILRYDFDEVLKWLIENLDKFPDFKEANGIKSLFTSRSTVLAYQDFIKALDKFYEYDI